jgi:hypothetical protein
VTIIFKQFTEKRTLRKCLYTSRVAAVIIVSRKRGTHRMKVAQKILIAKPHRRRPQGKSRLIRQDNIRY